MVSCSLYLIWKLAPLTLKKFCSVLISSCLVGHTILDLFSSSISSPVGRRQCCGSETGSSSEFSEFRIQIRIHADPDPTHDLSIFGNCKQIHLKFNHKEESIYYLPFSISHYSPTVHQGFGARAARSRGIWLEPEPSLWPGSGSTLIIC